MAAIATATVAMKTSTPIVCTMLSFVMLSSPLLTRVPIRVVQDPVELFLEELFILWVVAVQH